MESKKGSQSPGVRWQYKYTMLFDSCIQTANESDVLTTAGVLSRKDTAPERRYEALLEGKDDAQPPCHIVGDDWVGARAFTIESESVR